MTNAKRDDLWLEAVAFLTARPDANVYHLQRRLRIGYPRACRLMDAVKALLTPAPASEALRLPREDGRS